MSHKIHLLHYVILFLILASGLAGFLVLSFKPFYQFLVIVATVVGYVIWGIAHHYLEDRLSWGVIVEYFLIGTLVIFLFGLVLIR